MQSNICFITLFICLQLATAGSALSQHVYQVEQATEADVLLHYVDYRSSADLMIYYTSYQSQARQKICDGIWYSTPYRSQADFTLP